ncbi:MAG: dephospho-CoA kinase [Burkholderiaceae bacterium]|nr:dephospho-CoA kinase [Burkholderiaceae bacterium]
MSAAAKPQLAPAPTQASGATPPVYRVALTGGIGSGKSTVADRFVARGAVLVDTDAIAHTLTAPGGTAIPVIRQRFGDGMITADGRLDRAAMRELAFADPTARKALEAILHPMIRAETQRQVQAAAEAGAEYVILAIPLLVESGDWHGRVERVAVVDCPRETQISRVMTRSSLSREEVEAILRAQASREARLAVADDVIDNGGELAALDPQIDALHREYVARARAARHGGQVGRSGPLP